MKATQRRTTSKKNQTVRYTGEKQVAHNKIAIFMALLAVLALSLFISAKFGNIANAAEGTEHVEYKYYTTITVEKGDTLWDLALENYSEKYYDSVDDYVDEVKAINGLKNDTIHEGAKLVIVYFSSEYK